MTEAVCVVRYPESGDAVPRARYVFEYTDAAADAVRYANMINWFLMGEDNDYYRYFWY